MDDRELAQEFKTLHEENQLIIEILTTLGKTEETNEEEEEEEEEEENEENEEKNERIGEELEDERNKEEQDICNNCGKDIEECNCTIDERNKTHNQEIEKTLKTGLKIKKKQTEEDDY